MSNPNYDFDSIRSLCSSYCSNFSLGKIDYSRLYNLRETTKTNILEGVFVKEDFLDKLTMLCEYQDKKSLLTNLKDVDVTLFHDEIGRCCQCTDSSELIEDMEVELNIRMFVDSMLPSLLEVEDIDVSEVNTYVFASTLYMLFTDEI